MPTKRCRKSVSQWQKLGGVKSIGCNDCRLKAVDLVIVVVGTSEKSILNMVFPWFQCTFFGDEKSHFCTLPKMLCLSPVPLIL